jgi:predicted transcriptional regulator of viral defense system
MPIDNRVAKLYQTQKTILTNKDLALIWQETSPDNLKAKIAYYVKQGVLIRLTRGVFAKNRDYDPKELANSIYSPSYIGFETALREEGIIFQHYDTIFVAAPWSKTVTVDKTAITFRKLKDSILYNSAGVENKEYYSMASPERAFLDAIYLFPKYYFDNLRSIDWDKCFALVAIYGNQQLIKRLKRYQKKYAQ